MKHAWGRYISRFDSTITGRNPSWLEQIAFPHTLQVRHSWCYFCTESFQVTNNSINSIRIAWVCDFFKAFTAVHLKSRFRFVVRPSTAWVMSGVLHSVTVSSSRAWPPMTVENDTTTLSRNVGHCSSSDPTPYPKRKGDVNKLLPECVLQRENLDTSCCKYRLWVIITGTCFSSQ